MNRKITEYHLVSKPLETDFWGEQLPEQTKFNQEVMRLINSGWQPFGEVKSSPSIPGGAFASSKTGFICQAMVKYED